MDQRHYNQELDRFVNHELERSEQQVIAEHLLVCADCRTEHDLIKSGAALAQQLPRCDAPAGLWERIDNGLNAPQISFTGRDRYMRFQTLTGVAVGVLLAIGIAAAVYFSVLTPTSEPIRTAVQTEQPAVQSESPLISGAVPEIANANILPINSNTNSQPDVTSPELASLPSWGVQTIAGDPSVGGTSGDRLSVGSYLETDNRSKAQISVADIGNVVIEPNSRVKLVGTASTQHRLSLERGALIAQIAAPPRLFIVDTPSAVAVDLGCEYKLEVDNAGNTRLHVTSGFVALERGGRESIVPAGAVCITKRSAGLGTPFSAETSDAFRTALETFDFSNGGSRSVAEMLAVKNYYDIVTLWHLLSRVQKADREKIYEALTSYVQPPSGVTREGILKLNRSMLDDWRAEVESAWFEQ